MAVMARSPFWLYSISAPAPSSLEPHTLSHAVEKAEVFETEDLKSVGGLIAEADFLPGQIEPGQQVVIELGRIHRVRPHSQRDISLIAHRIKTNAPQQPPLPRRLAARQNQTDDQFVVTVQKFRLRVALHMTAHIIDRRSGALNDFRAQGTQARVEHDAVAIAVCAITLKGDASPGFTKTSHHFSKLGLNALEFER
ncbi:hypothetical protein [Salibaculum griseiflavum]|uniref:hypothetical protein n=1 Tax=Salibaculum griseiflavum TaxID=1914409 RepID=UPI0011B23FFA|nr:hypothetical protein [Salibaculum griseiflavum]